MKNINSSQEHTDQQQPQEDHNTLPPSQEGEVLEISSSSAQKKKVFFIAVGIIPFLLILFFIYFSFLPSVPEKSTPSRTQQTPSSQNHPSSSSQPSSSQENNAYFDLIKLNETLDVPQEKEELLKKMAAGETWDEAFAREIVRRNQRSFDLFLQASLRPAFQNPAFAREESLSPYNSISSGGPWVTMARLSALKSLLLAKEGKEREALDELFIPLTLGQKIQESRTFFMEYIIALTLKSISLETLQRLLPSLHLPS